MSKTVSRQDVPRVTFEDRVLHELKKIVTLLRLIIHEQEQKR